MIFLEHCFCIPTEPSQMPVGLLVRSLMGLLGRRRMGLQERWLIAQMRHRVALGLLAGQR